jgi:hypothetical protein
MKLCYFKHSNILISILVRNSDFKEIQRLKMLNRIDAKFLHAYNRRQFKVYFERSCYFVVWQNAAVSRVR